MLGLIRRRTRFPKSRSRSWLALAALVTALSPACGSDDAKKALTVKPHVEGPSAKLEVTAGFPDDAVQESTNSLHVWVVVPGDSGTTCADLVGGTVDPYDPKLKRVGDAVSKNPGDGVTDSDAGVGKALVYVEAVDYSGAVLWAGCKEVDVKQPTTRVDVTLGRAGVFDCGDPATLDGLPCDDGDFCTVGESCDGGDCQGGKPRDCTHLTSGCMVGTCQDESCVAEPASNGRTCDDGEPCSSGDVCENGECVGHGRDCDAEAGPCQVAIGCSPITGACEFTQRPYGTVCDDGRFCTDRDQCDSFGSCSGTTRDCTGGGCAAGNCNETLDRCDVTPYPAGQSCSDGLYCTSSDTCDGAGQCSGTPATCAGSCTSYDPACMLACECSEAEFGTCRPTYQESGSACDDSEACTTSDQCDTFGQCLGTPRPYGTLCDDGTVCTTSDQCDSFGQCSGTYEPYGTACTTQCVTSGTCDGAGDCYYMITSAPAGTTCDDGNACTASDRCDGFGYCSGTATVCP